MCLWEIPSSTLRAPTAPELGLRPQPPLPLPPPPLPSLLLKDVIEKGPLIVVANGNYGNSVILATPNTFC